MTWRYEQSTGRLSRNGKLVTTGYSGDGPEHAEGRNNPDMESVKGKGPIPRGRWRIGNPRTSPHVGPLAMDLTPVGHDAHRRSAFMIHGDNAARDASKGCIILGKTFRQAIIDSADRDLEVVR